MKTLNEIFETNKGLLDEPEVHEIKCKFFCNAGHTEESMTVDIYENNGTEEHQIEKEFLKWLDNNEDCGWEKI